MSLAVEEYISRSKLSLCKWPDFSYKLVKECGKKFPSVHNKRKGKGWKRALTSNSTVETRYQASIPIFECGKTNTNI